MEEQFVDFLKKHGAYGQFLRNVKNPIKDVEDADEYFYEAFTWDETPEGHDYWSALNRKWIDKDWSTKPDISGIAYRFPQYSKTAFLSQHISRGDKIYLLEVLNDSTLPKTAVVDELIHGNGYVEVYLR